MHLTSGCHMFIKYTVILILLFMRSTFAVVGEESVILSGILSQQIQAVAGISQIITNGKKHIEEVEKLKRAYDAFEDKRSKIQRALYYADRLGRFKDERKRIKSLVELRDNLQDAKNLIDDRHDLTLGIEILNSTSKHADDTAVANSKKVYIDKSELNRLQASLLRSKTNADFSKASANASVFTATQMKELNDNLNSLILYKSSQLQAQAIREKSESYKDFIAKKAWGVVPNISYAEYLEIINDSRKQRVN